MSRELKRGDKVAIVVTVVDPKFRAGLLNARTRCGGLIAVDHDEVIAVAPIIYDQAFDAWFRADTVQQNEFRLNLGHRCDDDVRAGWDAAIRFLTGATA